MWEEVLIMCLIFLCRGRGVEGGVDHVLIFVCRGAWCGRRC